MLILFQGWKLFRYSSSLGNEFSWSSILPPNIYSVSSIPEKYRRNICRNLLFILAGLILAERNIHSPTAIMLLRKKLPYTCFVGAFILNNKTFYKIYYIMEEPTRAMGRPPPTWRRWSGTRSWPSSPRGGPTSACRATTTGGMSVIEE